MSKKKNGAQKFIRVRGAAEHNLRQVDLDLPHNALCVITGLSGSGKSSLAFDTIFVEGQRRYMESLSAYARQFLQMMQKPAVEQITGLPPTIAIEQRKGQANPRSTVATVTEIYDYLRLLFARAGQPFCPQCGKMITRQTPQQIVDNIIKVAAGKRLMLLAPVVRGRKGEHRAELQTLRREGYPRARLDGELCEIRELEACKHKNRKHTIEAVIDRLAVKKTERNRLAEAVERGLPLGQGLVVAAVEEAPGRFVDHLYSERYGCVDCDFSFPELEPRMFSFNSPYGACPACDGLGTRQELDLELVVPDWSLSLSEGAIAGWKFTGRQMGIYYHRLLREFAQYYRVDLDIPFQAISKKKREILLHGDPDDDWWEGVLADLARRYRTTDSEFIKNKIHEFMSQAPCQACHGTRLREEALAVRVAGKNIFDLVKFNVEQALSFINEMKLDKEQTAIAKPIRKEVAKRLGFMRDVGLEYLTLDRMAGSLSGGEAQRIRLASQVGQGLVGVCYVLDEPTIGLHQRDNARLLNTLRQMSDLGNTVIIVEHDEDVIRAADYLVDVGPGAGRHGGQIVAAGTVAEVKKCKKSLTGLYLAGHEMIHVPAKRRPVDLKKAALKLSGARENNLRNVDAVFPLGVLTCVTGVSGSGKSTLVSQTLKKVLQRELGRSKVKPGAYNKITGLKRIDKIIDIDQSPIGKTPRSNPATYTNLFTLIRQLFAGTEEAKVRGYQPGRFSFNVKGGRCEHCQGAGLIKIEMHFLPDVYVECAHCRGRRYNRETLEVRYKGKNITEVLAMTISEAAEFFQPVPGIRQILQTLLDVGLGYVALGQSSTTLSGGEAQRMKLASELAKKATGKTVYILDEPTTGLHFADIKKLLKVLGRLVERGNTVIVIEHNLDVIKCADWLLDLGPEGGEHGGELLVAGTPETVAACKASHTGRYLQKILAAGKSGPLAAAVKLGRKKVVKQSKKKAAKKRQRR